MDIFIIVVLVVVLVALIAKVKAKRKKEAEAAKPVVKSGWYIEHSPGMPARPTLLDKGWFFDFSTDPGSHVHYVPWYQAPTLIGAESITARFTITGGGFVPQDMKANRTATVTMIIQRKGDNWGAQGEFEAYRQYSGKMIVLADGEYEFTVPVDHLHFGGVMGSHDPVAFDAVLADMDNFGLVFGSAGGRGHGVYATEPSRFTLLEMKVNYEGEYVAT